MLRRNFCRIFLGGAFVLAIAAAILVWDGLTDTLGPADVGLVLGNTVHPGGRPSARLQARLDRALELYQRGVFPWIVVSGARGREGHDEAAVMRDYLVERGVPRDKVLVDSAGVTTFASARNVCTILDQRQLRAVCVITQYFHIPRARLALQRVGIAPVYSAHAHYFELRDIYSIARELIAYPRYFLRGPTARGGG